MRSLVFHPNGKYLLSASDDRSIRIWEIKTGRCIRTIAAHDRFVSSLSWGRQATGTEEGKEGDASNLMNVLVSGSSDQVSARRVGNMTSARIWLCCMWLILAVSADDQDLDAMMRCLRYVCLFVCSPIPACAPPCLRSPPI